MILVPTSHGQMHRRIPHVDAVELAFVFIYIYKQIQILYSLRITTCNQQEVHNLTRLFCYNNTKWLIDLGREKVSFENIELSSILGRTFFPLSLYWFPSTKSNYSPTKLIFTYAHTYVLSQVYLHICVYMYCDANIFSAK